MNLVKRNEMAEKYGRALDNNVPEEVIDEDVISFEAPKQGKKIPQLYICEFCGRKKTIRFKEVPTPANGGKCPRCKKGTLYSDFVYKNYKRLVMKKEAVDAK